MNTGYKKFIEENLDIVNKKNEIIPFKLNKIQEKYLLEDYSGKDVILKARQQGFSSLILALFTVDFLLKENTRSVIVADISDNAMELLDRVKFYIGAYEYRNKVKIPLKYNSKYELFNEAKNSRYSIGTADNSEYGRSKTITNLHLSEFGFYKNPQKLFTGAMQAVIPNGRVIIETTANGFNYLKTFWDECIVGERNFKPSFYGASSFYSKEFLGAKKKELKEFFSQEYPETPNEAFLRRSGLVYKPFDSTVHVKEIEDFKPVYYLRGLDRGFTNPTAVPLIEVDKDDNWYQTNELYQSGLTNPPLFNAVNDLCGDKDFELSTMDSAQAGDLAELNDLGHDWLPVKKESGESKLNYVRWKIQKFTDRLTIKDDGKPSYFVHPRCKETIREFDSYRWKEKKSEDGDTPEEPEKAKDHMMDAIADLNAMYMHWYKPKKKGIGHGKIPGTFIRKSPVKDDNDEENDWGDDLDYEGDYD